MDERQRRLVRRFRNQQAFAAHSSPLYGWLFGIFADWLEQRPGDDPLVEWLLRATAERASFDVPMLLMAGLHRDILAGCHEVGGLAASFPSVGGMLSTDAAALADHLHQAVWARRSQLADFLATATVQTNEPARGLCWLLPLLWTGWEAIHLVELGASAGLNLVADQYRYWLSDAVNEKIVLQLGNNDLPQFSVANEGPLPKAHRQAPPVIRSRTGCDLAPLLLHNEQDHQVLAGFVWGDQVDRLQALRQAMAVLHRINSSEVPVRLYLASLPEALPRFLEEQITPLVGAPVVLYNTYLTSYLRGKGDLLRPYLAAWAAKQHHPVLWLQWETLWQGPKSPRFGWVGWTADCWLGDHHHKWHLAWTHPHGSRIQWLPGMADWSVFARRAL